MDYLGTVNTARNKVAPPAPDVFVSVIESPEFTQKELLSVFVPLPV